VRARFLCWFYALTLGVVAICIQKKKSKKEEEKRRLKVVVDES
jgi:hypothetical protein